MANQTAPSNAEDILSNRPGPMPDESEFNGSDDVAAGQVGDQWIDPIIVERMNDDRLPDQIVIDAKEQAAEQSDIDRGDHLLREAKARDAASFGGFASRMSDSIKRGSVDVQKIHDPSLTISDDALTFAKANPHGPELLEYLADNQEFARSLVGMPASEVDKKLTNVARSISPQVTQAPDPPSYVGGGGSPGRRDPSKMSMDEYVAGRRSGKIK